MKIVFLDAKTIGDDIDLSGFDSLVEVPNWSVLLQPEPTIWIKTIWIPTKLPGETLPVIPQKQLLSIHLPCFSICLKSCAITMIM